MLKEALEKRMEIILKQEEERIAFWHEYFLKISNALVNVPELEKVTFEFEDEHVSTFNLNRAELQFKSIEVSYVFPLNISDSRIEEVYEIENKIKYTTSEALPLLIKDLTRLDCDDTIIVSASGVHSNFRHYDNWDSNRPNNSKLGLD